AESGKSQWEYNGQKRPKFAIKPKEGQESVWDYPRPPKLHTDSREILVIFANKIIARSTNTIRVLETASPPTFYIPKADINMDYLKKTTGETRCEWKGDAIYWNVEADDKIAKRAAWSYPQPKSEFSKIKGYLCFYPSRVFCYVNGEHVKPQPGGFYGGWITKEIVGPVKGESDETFL
ncbi:MAG TPA: DUF427 domain-containing protein, partial [Gracilimonas sp.]|uniref:DUF427 domain-containing protein n=1 Tax=Gracilimonas sp. TaxID=1974203 RepID=UPI002DB39F4E|nr:DUF427 domain-containing protein [Gracilimonas sp.]